MKIDNIVRELKKYKFKCAVWWHDPEDIHSGEWVENGFITLDGEEINLDGDIMDYKPDDEYSSFVVCPYSKFKDEMGKQLKAGDILEHNDGYDIEYYVLIYSEDEDNFMFLDVGGFETPLTDFLNIKNELEGVKIVGNIFENPELVEGI